ncbi:hypothetical protein [Algiphilus aromaticivorans]|uniref:hypothetical protein n=1 Tax=Algiphilus aromaticivorans TaxID=382454 RepID=UPI0005C22435|nr:hypothetical protein [Algiphilus aromaticivorans]
MRPIPLQLSALLLSAILLAACGGGNDSSGGTVPPDNGGQNGGDNGGGTGGDGGDGGDPAGGSKTCQDDFSTERLDNGESCAPRYAAFCPSNRGDEQFTHDSVVPCDGVLIEEISVDSEESFEGELQYIVMRPANAEPEAVLVNLHFRQLLREPITAAATHAVVTRQAELVKARNVMVILPGAPGGVWPSYRLIDDVAGLTDGSLVDQVLAGLLDGGLVDNPLVDRLTELGLPIGLLEDALQGDGDLSALAGLISGLTPSIDSTEDFMDYIELAREDALSRFGGAELPQFMAGLSNGGIYALRFACERPELGLDAVMSVAGAMGPSEAEACRGRDPIGTVQVHGARDFVSPYNGFPTYPVRGGPLLPLDLAIFDGLDVPLPGDEGLEPPEELAGLSGILELPGLFLDVFAPNNSCGGALNVSTIPAGAAGQGEGAGDILIEHFESCDNPQGRRSYMVTVEEGGHNWPGYDAPFGNEANVNVFGAVSYDFDATLYGYDLMRRAAGLN